MRPSRLAFALLCALPLAAGARAAWACGGGTIAKAKAFPGAGATDVSPQSSIFLVASSQEVPPGLTLLADGQAVALPGVTSLGTGLAADGWASFYRIAGPLMASTSYALQAGVPAPASLTQFSTAAAYDKDPGTAAAVNSLRLWRVHYPPARVNAGGCVSSEYEGYFALDFTPASIPGTPAAEVVSVLTLSSEQLGTAQSFVFSGITALPGGLAPAVSGDGVVLSSGEALSAGAALWKPDLETGRSYCATIVSYGRNDLAAGPLQSAKVCATVVGLDSGNTTGGGGAAGGGGTGAGGQGGGTGAGGAAGGGVSGGGGGAGAGGAGGASPDGPAGSGGTTSYPIGDDLVKSGGCSCAAAPGGGTGSVAGIAVAVLVAGLRKRRSPRMGSQR